MTHAIFLGRLVAALALASSAHAFSPRPLASRRASTAHCAKKKVVVIGNGMVGQRVLERLAEYDTADSLELSTFCEERLTAYDRVKLTSYFESRAPDALSMSGTYEDSGKTAWYVKKRALLLAATRS